MCGIAGIIGAGGWPHERLSDATERLGRAIAHRGPDDAGVWVDPSAGVGLAHRRLAIIDLSPHGHQPMVSIDGRHVLVFNGEIYNHRDLRAGLEKSGFPFRGSSDTEVLLAGITTWGLRPTLERSNGMFAIGLWDRKRRELSLARDRLGEKPLVVGHVDGALTFGSELRALTALPGTDLSVSLEATSLFLRHGFFPAPWTPFEGFRKIDPGTISTYDVTGTLVRVETYWSLTAAAEEGLDNPLRLPDDQLVDMTEELLRDSVRLRREADVPVGTFLSGGVDSSLVAAMLASESGDVRTFTVAVGGDLDESQRANKVAQRLGTRHTTLPLEVDPHAIVSEVLPVYDEPFADPSAIPTTLLCRAVRAEVTVALSGDGGDEIFAGYNRYRGVYGLVGRIGSLPTPMRRTAGRTLLSIPAARWDAFARAMPLSVPAAGVKAHKLGTLLIAADAYDGYLQLASLWNPHEVLPNVEEPATAITNPSRLPPFGDPLSRMLLADSMVTLPDDMLVKVDRAAMAVALETRVPLLDHRLVELSWRLPASAKVRKGHGKWVLREVLKRYLPLDLIAGPKTGFDPPLGDWLRGPLRPWAEDLLSASRLRRQGLVDPVPIRRLWGQHLAGSRHAEYPIWALLVLSSWLDAVSEGAMAA